MRTALTGRTHGCTDQPLRREDSPCQLGAVHTWHRAAQNSRGDFSGAGGTGRASATTTTIEDRKRIAGPAVAFLAQRRVTGRFDPRWPILNHEVAGFAEPYY